MATTSTQNRRPILAALLIASIAALFVGLAAPTISRAEENPECSRPEFSPYQGAWNGRTFPYFTAHATFPNSASGQQDEARRMIIRGHNDWDTTLNDCGNSDQNNMTTDWSGDSTCAYGVDRLNCVDFGDMGAINCAGALACTYQLMDTNGNAYESDMRFSTNGVNWWTYGSHIPAGTQYDNFFDLWGVAAHETGHTIGLGHATATYDQFLTMYPTIGPRQYHWRTLGRGDIIGLRARYPSRARTAACTSLALQQNPLDAVCGGDGEPGNLPEPNVDGAFG